ncbi:uncharacterized protein FMAN_09025 [Fusarium mangiferae]|uniref:Major facilitator superfamily (MFS) profile domain-containing protein n=1 Tax=Fusarium mangiferae TaxID=192010 RepID=A0A1L7T681_FUSMA|nr:uncharacterized protein FMAN_09025 [Fusarium mangiferae]CVK90787.1 uncharacterized protein FMAN_09025 [Fusarium mangiferae]
MFFPEDSGDGSGSPQPTVNAEEIIMADGTVEYVDKYALGDELDRMPNGYYRSPQFIGTLAAPLISRLRKEAFSCSVKPLVLSGVFNNTGLVAVVTCATVASMVYYSLTVLWPTIISTLYTADSIKVGWQSGVIGGGVVLGQAMSGLAIAYVPRLKIQCMCVAALAWLSSRRCVPYPLTGGQIQSHSG